MLRTLRYSFLLIIISIIYSSVKAQYIPLDNYLQQRVMESVNEKRLPFMGSLKPWMASEFENYLNLNNLLYEDSLLSGKNNKWLRRKLLSEHLIKYSSEGINITLDPLFHFGLGKESEAGRFSWQNTRGFTLDGRVGKKLFFNTSFYENQAKFPSWMDKLTRDWGVVPGQSKYKGYGKDGFDYNYTSGYVLYQPVKVINLAVGYGKNFIGDGYRSLILSDIAPNYPYLKIGLNTRKVKFTTIYAQMMELHSKTYPEFGLDRRWMAAHYLQFMLFKRLELGLYETVIWENSDAAGFRGFDFQYVNPFVFFKSIEQSNGFADNNLAGATFNLRIDRHFNFYGQIMLDEFRLKEFFNGKGWWGNKNGWQLGVSGWNLFNVRSLVARIEYNTIRPYTYSHWSMIESYSHYAQPLAHPLMANFREFIGIVSYKYKNWYASFKTNISLTGEDVDGKNVGHNIFLSYDTHYQEYGNTTGQGLRTDMIIADGNLSYLLNRRTGLSIEAGAVYRKKENRFVSENTVLFYGGIRTGLRNLYHDF